jgi:hypothetical protein
LHCFDCWYNVEKMFDSTQNFEFFHYNILHEPSTITMLVNKNKIQQNVTNDIKQNYIYIQTFGFCINFYGQFLPIL